MGRPFAIATSHQPSAISHQPSAISHKPSATTIRLRYDCRVPASGAPMRPSKWFPLPFIPVLALVVVSAQPPKTFKARLSPVPLDVAMQATVAGSGSVSAVLTGSKLSISGTFEGLRSPATIAQIHKGPIRGVRGPIVFDLSVSKASDGTSGTLSG